MSVEKDQHLRAQDMFTRRDLDSVCRKSSPASTLDPWRASYASACALVTHEPEERKGKGHPGLGWVVSQYELLLGGRWVPGM